MTWSQRHAVVSPTKCELGECIVEEGAEETGQLIISEIQDDPRGLDAEREFIELHNPGDSADLTGWWLQNCGAKRVNSKDVFLGGYFVVARSSNREVNGGLSADDELGEGVHMGNGQGAILLFNPERELVDQVRYESIPPWPMRQPGQSLERFKSIETTPMGHFGLQVEMIMDPRQGHPWSWASAIAVNRSSH